MCGSGNTREAFSGLLREIRREEDRSRELNPSQCYYKQQDNRLLLD